MNAIKELSMDKKEWEIYESRQRWIADYENTKANLLEEGEARGKKIGQKIGQKIGKAEGEKNAKIEIAKKMLEKNIPIDQIAELTGLKESEIEKIKVEM